MKSKSLITVWKQIILGKEKSWVAFSNGTCVILMEPRDDLKKQAVEIMKEWGAVHAGSPAGDFSVIRLSEYPGWVVNCHHPDILTYVSPDEISEDAEDIVIGLIGRKKRDQDAERLEVIHVEDRRKSG
ncbi:hypothetical protein QUF72_14870 [Desulfobacterales bacterium HSG2]|nr:hypothetical protein [Desulfobacterales bacterium HSG2]